MELYPEIEPFDTGFLKVSNTHELYWEQIGNPKGAPVIFLHGGPGGGITPDYRRFFDPEFYRVILFDQRGAGKSKPHAEIQDNTTWDLVSDIEKIRKHFDISQWIVFGGSWGSTLSLIYAESHPESIKALCLRGIFMCRRQEILWFYQEGASRIFPDAFRPYKEFIPENERNDLVAAYYKRLTSEDKALRLQAARHWSVWEGSTSFLTPQDSQVEKFDEPDFALAFARIECHYFTNHIFLENDSWILDKTSLIQDVPIDIIHGRYDVVCPVENAFDLKNRLPKARLFVIDQAGHSAFEPGITSQLLESMEGFKKLF